MILRLHDSFRFEPAYRDFITGLARRHSNVLLKFKDHHPDNLLDMQVSDVLMTNYSSIANLFYATSSPAPVGVGWDSSAWSPDWSGLIGR